jgi:hypothetical protein
MSRVNELSDEVWPTSTSANLQTRETVRRESFLDAAFLRLLKSMLILAKSTKNSVANAARTIYGKDGKRTVKPS